MFTAVDRWLKRYWGADAQAEMEREVRRLRIPHAIRHSWVQRQGGWRCSKCDLDAGRALQIEAFYCPGPPDVVAANSPAGRGDEPTPTG